MDGNVLMKARKHIKTKPGSPVLLGDTEMRRLKTRGKADEKTLLILTPEGEIIILPFRKLRNIFEYNYFGIPCPLEKTEPTPRDYALVYYAGIEFDNSNQAIIGKTNQVVFGALIAQLPKEELETLRANEVSQELACYSSQ